MPGIGGIFHPETHILFCATFWRSHDSDGQKQTRAEQSIPISPLYNELVSAHTHSVLHPGKQESPEFKDTSHPSKNIQGACEMRTGEGCGWGKSQGSDRDA